MEPVRLLSGSSLLELTKDTRATTYLEAYAFLNSCKTGHFHGIPVWHYATGTTLYESDRPEVHQKERLASYLDLIEFAIAAWTTSASVRLDPKSIETLSNVQSESFSGWQSAYLSGLTRAKEVLQERQDTGQFIQCRKCKSNEVDTDQKQTRSADEPMTIFCKCRKCETRFIMN